jgi:hypothetical protein
MLDVLCWNHAGSFRSRREIDAPAHLLTLNDNTSRLAQITAKNSDSTPCAAPGADQASLRADNESPADGAMGRRYRPKSLKSKGNPFSA